MSSVTDLLASLITSTLQYHQIILDHDKTIVSKYREKPSTAQELMDKPFDDMMQELKERIEEAARNESTRRPLLDYVLGHIELVRTFKDLKEPFADDKIASLKAQLIQFVTDIQKLLKTSQATEVAMHFQLSDYKMYGFMRRAWNLWGLCRSGAVLQNNLFPALSLTSEAKAEDIQTTIHNLVDTHHIQVNKASLCAFKASLDEKSQSLQLKEEALNRLANATPKEGASASKSTKSKSKDLSKPEASVSPASKRHSSKPPAKSPDQQSFFENLFSGFFPPSPSHHSSSTSTSAQPRRPLPQPPF